MTNIALPVTTPTQDPWAHRSSGMRCRSCMWFVEKVPDPADKAKYNMARASIGRCRRHAPTMTGFPVVYDSDWCGDHRLDESKVLPG